MKYFIIIKTINNERDEENTMRKRRVFKIFENNKFYNIQSSGILPVFMYNNKKYFLMMNEKKYDKMKKTWNWKGFSDFGGKIEYQDQTLFEAALREFNEETNFKFTNFIDKDFLKKNIVDFIISDKYNNKSINIIKDQTKSIIFIINFGKLTKNFKEFIEKYGLYAFIHSTPIILNNNFIYKLFEIDNVYKSFYNVKEDNHLIDSYGTNYGKLHPRLQLYNIK
jgi:hypothetical protein